MAILAYQAFIVFSLIAIRVVARHHLAKACLVWSAFTVFNLFFWPLILVQLAVVWITYAVLKPQGDRPHVPEEKISSLADSPLKPAESRPAIQPRTHADSRLHTKTPTFTPPTAAAHKTAEHDASPSFLGAINKNISSINTIVKRVSTIDKAMSRLNVDIAREKIAIELGLAIARESIERDIRFSKDPGYRKHYEHFLSDLDKLSPEDDKEDPLLDFDLPNFRLPVRHEDESIAEEIELRIREMQQRRDIFFSNLKQTLDRDPGLHTYFFKTVLSFKPSKVWEAELQARLQSPAPTASTSRLAFGSILDSASIAAQVKPQVRFTETQRKQQQAEKLEIEEAWARRKPSTPNAKAPPLSTTLPRKSKQTQIVKLTVQADAVTTICRSHIQAQATKRGIRHLVHFTRVANLPSIMSYGLLSVQAAQQQGLTPLANDQLRLDGHNDAVSLSISFPNAAMFYKYRQLHPQDRWVVLLLRPEVLWTHDCALCQHNAADRRVRSRPWSDLTTSEAFQSMFDEAPEGARTRTAQRLGPQDPTDVQAEVLVRGHIAPSLVMQMVFEHQDDLEVHHHHNIFGRARVQIPGSDFFASRGRRGSVA